VAEAALAAGLIVNAVRPDAIRLIPPLTISSEEVELAVELFAKSLVSVDG
jgi:4-aminobutyrate aminotransferase-like enzyme